ncbi:MAG: hypothetical protein ACJ8LM_16590 [Candidatus Udaeobacter sp.]
MLWMLCTVEWMHENNEKISNNNLERLFGAEGKYLFNFYREIAIDTEYLQPDALTLTKKAKRVTANWRKFRDELLDV